MIHNDIFDIDKPIPRGTGDTIFENGMITEIKGNEVIIKKIKPRMQGIFIKDFHHHIFEKLKEHNCQLTFDSPVYFLVNEELDCCGIDMFFIYSSFIIGKNQNSLMKNFNIIQPCKTTIQNINLKDCSLSSTEIKNLGIFQSSNSYVCAENFYLNFDQKSKKKFLGDDFNFEEDDLDVLGLSNKDFIINNLDVFENNFRYTLKKIGNEWKTNKTSNFVKY